MAKPARRVKYKDVFHKRKDTRYLGRCATALKNTPYLTHHEKQHS